MGLDLIDVQIGIEEEFGIVLPQGPIVTGRGPRSDICIQDIVEWVAKAIAEQNPIEGCNVFERVRRVFAQTLNMSESEIREDSRIMRDLHV